VLRTKLQTNTGVKMATKIPGAKSLKSKEEPLLSAEQGINGAYPQVQMSASASSDAHNVKGGQQAVEDDDDLSFHAIKRR
jgi:hypothetical protein